MKIIGRNINSNDTATVTAIQINSVTATTISISNGERVSFTANMDEAKVDADIMIRYYPAAQDNDFKGHLLTRYTLGNSNLFNPIHKMCVDNVYTGEISAISSNGTHTLYITEY